MLNWVRDPDALPDEEDFLGMSGTAAVGGIRRMKSGMWRWEISGLPGLPANRDELTGRVGTPEDAKAKVEEMWGGWLRMAALPVGQPASDPQAGSGAGSEPCSNCDGTGEEFGDFACPECGGSGVADGKPGVDRVYVGSYATEDEYEGELDSPSVSLEALASPQFAGVCRSREDAVARMKEVALDTLRDEYVTLGGNWAHEKAQEEFEERYGGGAWEDGNWDVPDRGRPNSVHRYLKDGRVVAMVVVQEAGIDGGP